MKQTIYLNSDSMISTLLYEYELLNEDIIYKLLKNDMNPNVTINTNYDIREKTTKEINYFDEDGIFDGLNAGKLLISNLRWLCQESVSPSVTPNL